MDFLFELNARKRIAISQDVELILPQVKTDFALILFFLTIGLAGPKSLIYLVPKISLFFHALQLSLTALTNSSKIHSCIDFENSRCQSWHQIKKTTILEARSGLKDKQDFNNNRKVLEGSQLSQPWGVLLDVPWNQLKDVRLLCWDGIYMCCVTHTNPNIAADTVQLLMHKALSSVSVVFILWLIGVKM